jgi:hypothetical protein
MGKLIELVRTFKAKLFQVPWETEHFKVVGTLDGFIDLAVPHGGTYPLSLDEARSLATALSDAISDVKEHCLYERDALAAPPAT